MNKSLNAIIERTLEALRQHGVGQSGASVLRLALWIAFFLAALGHLFVPKGAPAQFESRKNGIKLLSMEAPFGDPRGFECPPPPSKDARRIAWIGDSSSQFRDENDGYAEYLPVEVLGQLQDGNAPASDEVLSYAMNGQRLYDSYVCLLDAVAQQPDAIVLTISPVWTFERRSLVFRRNLLRTAGQHIPLRLKDVAWYLAIAEPSDWADAILSPVFPSLRDRRAWHDGLDVAARPLRRVAMPTAPDTAANADNPAHAKDTVYPAVFLHDAYNRYGNDTDGPLSVKVYRRFQVDAAGTGNESVLRMLLDTARNAKIPCLVYCSPVNPDFLEDADFASKYLREVELLDALAADFASSCVRIIGTPPADALRPLRYLDYTHLYQGEQNSKYVRFLAEELREALSTNRGSR